MKKLLCTVVTSILLMAGSAQAGTKYIHAWNLGSSSNSRTDIDLTNTCGNNTATITMKFWHLDGNVLANEKMYFIGSRTETLTTNDNGEITFDLAANNRVRVNLTYSLISGTQKGHARVTTSYAEPGTRCVVGGYAISTTNSGKYGFHSYHINNGNRF